MSLNGKDGKHARPLVEIMQKAGQKIPDQLAQAAGTRNYDRADMGELLQQAEGPGMLSAESARMASQVVSAPQGASAGGYSRQPGDTNECNEQQVLQMLIRREQARKQRNYQMGDQIRDQMRGMGIEVDDQTRTWRCVATKMMGLETWNITHCTCPLFLENGICVRPFEIWWICTPDARPAGATVDR